MDNFKEHINSLENSNSNIIRAVNLIRRIRVAQSCYRWNKNFDHLSTQLSECMIKIFEDIGEIHG